MSVSAPAAHDHAHADSAKAEKRDPDATSSSLDSLSVDEFGHDTYDHTTAEGVSQLIAVGVLEFGVILHSFIIGLTLAVNQDFITLFIVIIFHRGWRRVGCMTPKSKLSHFAHRHRNVRRPRSWVPAVPAASPTQHGLVGIRRGRPVLDHDVRPLPPLTLTPRTPPDSPAPSAPCRPLGIAIGLGVRNSYNGNGATANAVSGILDAFSAGILLYTGLVEVRPGALLFIVHRLTRRYAAAARPRDSPQPQDDEGVERQARVRVCVHAAGQRPHGAAGPLGVSCRLRAPLDGWIASCRTCGG